ncbi:sulfotransferase family 2 domain-containing protein [Pseudosulfitobacter pseudonitzschiae]|uniref:sulfotransferase family 2 domain-containing protein n=1 Tax=Pseudosulfitobacter pseudonitzschiae TaxID=1402135 RepID=UPI001AF20ECD|nr:sulfotransferase family 2 domain-containing protein [Pseudosulfitobacter pseudonitzschiae]MBM1814965.1 sulfotransferase family 2 domain-containing protein [Pseudosulfitobacter pseudonitzschiae]MBM1831956.1 sulfotransferase family 2 domain-containing protein [Pseudosulfitobacter pseudonitzschiae]MBM1836824.1 sulfotransferase family 2 domain-containing protein [Pseudosulfitobacter pseudonitzschiae]MBM1841670.1 sulfotransferase family 2 domain-containing protein [Pseudosulfitobacter pseudonitzs
MIVSESLNCVFIHIPKTGGSSVRTMLAPALDLSRDLDIRSRKSVRGTRAACGMDPAAAIIKHSRLDRLGKLLGPARLTSMFSFAVVRNPFARAWSALAFVKRRAVSHADPEVRANCAPYLDMSFDDLASDLPAQARQMRSLLPQVKWVPSPQSVTHLARLETLAADWAVIVDKLGIANRVSPAPLHENASTDHEAWRSMSPTAAARVVDYYADDFAAFGYDTSTRFVARGVC